MSHSSNPLVTATVSSDGPGEVPRWTIVLPSGITLLVDHDSTNVGGSTESVGTVDVWVLPTSPVAGSATLVEVGDTPADGFATYYL